jgi:hypothetical protein
VIEIRSYRRVFELERRIYRIDRLRLNPGGVPVRGVVYFLALVGISMLAGALPLTTLIAHALPWYLRALILPALCAGLLAVIRIEGRPFHTAARALLGYRVSARRLAGIVRAESVGARWAPQEILMLPDGSDARVRRLSYRGPGIALVTVAHQRDVNGADRGWRDLRLGRTPTALTLRQLDRGRPLRDGQVLVLQRGARLVTSGR